MLAKPGTSDILLSIGIPLFSMGGIMLMTTNFQVSNYFTSRRGVVLNLFNGAIDSSSATALILASIYSFIGYQFTWALYCLVGFFVLSRTIFILPKQHIPQPLPEDWIMETPINSCSPKDESELKSNLIDDENQQKEGPKLLSSILSPLYISSLFFFVINVFRVYIFLGTMFNSTAEIIQIAKNVTIGEAQSAAGEMVTQFGMVQFAGLLFSPINGAIIDLVMAKTGSKYMSISASIFSTVTLGTLFSLFAIIPSVLMQYGTFLVSVIHRSFVFGCQTSLIGFSFPGEHFGKLFGISQLLTSLSSLAVGPVIGMGMTYGYKTVNTWILFAEMATMFHLCVCLYFHRNHAQNKK